MSLFLPEGILDYFKITDIVKSADAMTIHLEEENIVPKEHSGSGLTAHGFHEPRLVHDFPVRGKSCCLKVRRRRWLNEDTGLTVSRDWELVAKGTRMTGEFAAFLKGIARY